MTAGNYFAQGRKTLPSRSERTNSAALRIPVEATPSNDRRATKRLVQTEESRASFSTTSDRCRDARASERIRAACCRGSGILDKREIHGRESFTRHPRTGTSLRDARRPRDARNPKLAERGILRVNGPPPPHPRSPPPPCHLPQSRARSILLLRTTAATRSNSFFERRAKQVFDVARETTESPRVGGKGERGQTGR